MANVILHTEDFTDAEWTNNGTTITPGAAAAPSGFGSGAALATQLEDATTGAQSNVVGTYYTFTPNVSAIGSMFVRKDAVTSRQPTFLLTLNGGVRMDGGIILNTSTGVASVPTGDGTAPTAFGVIDYDSLYWRVWIKLTDTGSNDIARFYFAPAAYDNIGDFASSGNLGSFIGWGANLTYTTTIQPYEPAPAYAGQFARPGSDVLATGWTQSTGANLFGCIDEASPNGTDWISSPSAPNSQLAKLGLSSIGLPIAAGAVTMRVSTRRT